MADSAKLVDADGKPVTISSNSIVYNDKTLTEILQSLSDFIVYNDKTLTEILQSLLTSSEESTNG